MIKPCVSSKTFTLSFDVGSSFSQQSSSTVYRSIIIGVGCVNYFCYYNLSYSTALFSVPRRPPSQPGASCSLSKNVSPETQHDMAERSITAQPPHWGAAGRRWLIYMVLPSAFRVATNVRMSRASSASVPVAQSAAAAGVAPAARKLQGWPKSCPRF